VPPNKTLQQTAAAILVSWSISVQRAAAAAGLVVRRRCLCAEFDRYYNEVHIPIAKRMKGLKGWTIGKCESATPGEQPPYYMIVGLYAATRADLEAILASPEGRATIADVPNFATGGFTFMFDDEVVLIPCSLGGSAVGGGR
jgi:uncharacterized protein (TIGR02118 family)